MKQIPGSPVKNKKAFVKGAITIEKCCHQVSHFMNVVKEGWGKTVGRKPRPWEVLVNWLMLPHSFL